MSYAQSLTEGYQSLMKFLKSLDRSVDPQALVYLEACIGCNRIGHMQLLDRWLPKDS
jgi:hypothetical protein